MRGRERKQGKTVVGAAKDVQSDDGRTKDARRQENLPPCQLAHIRSRFCRQNILKFLLVAGRHVVATVCRVYEVFSTNQDIVAAGGGLRALSRFTNILLRRRLVLADKCHPSLRQIRFSHGCTACGPRRCHNVHACCYKRVGDSQGSLGFLRQRWHHQSVG